MKFIRNYIFVLSGIVLLAGTCTYGQTIKGNGNVKEEVRQVDNFSGIKVSHGWDLYLSQGEENSLRIVADENLLEHAITEVKDGILLIYSDQKILQSKKREVYVVCKEIEMLFASGGSDIKVSGTLVSNEFKLGFSGGSDLSAFSLDAKKLEAAFTGGSDAQISLESVAEVKIEAAGGSDVYAELLSVSNCFMSLSGGSDAELSGEVESIVLKAAGGSDIDAGELTIQYCNISCTGASDAEIHVVGTIDASLSGGSDLSCTGNPEVKSIDAGKSCDYDIR